MLTLILLCPDDVESRRREEVRDATSFEPKEPGSSSSWNQF
jgi:hypothetical protein